MKIFLSAKLWLWTEIPSTRSHSMIAVRHLRLECSIWIIETLQIYNQARKMLLCFSSLKQNIKENFRKTKKQKNTNVRSGGGGPFCAVRWFSHFFLIISKKKNFPIYDVCALVTNNYLVKIWFLVNSLYVNHACTGF